MNFSFDSNINRGLARHAASSMHGRTAGSSRFFVPHPGARRQVSISTPVVPSVSSTNVTTRFDATQDFNDCLDKYEDCVARAKVARLRALRILSESCGSVYPQGSQDWTNCILLGRPPTDDRYEQDIFECRKGFLRCMGINV